LSQKEVKTIIFSAIVNKQDRKKIES